MVRPICPEDEPLMVEFHKTLSETSVYRRYFHLISLNQRITHQRLSEICASHYDSEMVLVVELKREDARPQILAVGRLSRLKGSKDAEFAIIVSDSFQGRGIGTKLLSHLIKIARMEKMDRILGLIIPDNHGMQNVCRKLGFQLTSDLEEKVVRAEYKV